MNDHFKAMVQPPNNDKHDKDHLVTAVDMNDDDDGAMNDDRRRTDHDQNCHTDAAVEIVDGAAAAATAGAAAGAPDPASMLAITAPTLTVAPSSTT